LLDLGREPAQTTVRLLMSGERLGSDWLSVFAPVSAGSDLSVLDVSPDILSGGPVPKFLTS